MMKYGEYIRLNFGSYFGYVVGARDYLIVREILWERVADRHRMSGAGSLGGGR